MEGRSSMLMPDRFEERRRAGARASLDERVTRWLAHEGVTTLRVGIGLLYLWFGGLKVIGSGPARHLIESFVSVMPGSILLPAIGTLEIAIGIAFISGWGMRPAMVLLALQIPALLLPFVFVPEDMFFAPPVLLTLPGQYVLKSVLLSLAAIIVGATVRAWRIPNSPA
jgi:uncharacterized membrane protein YkgB